MAYMCDNCGKGIVVGRTSSHARGIAGKRWKKRAQKTARTFKPNLQMYMGQKLCTDCVSRIKKDKKAA